MKEEKSEGDRTGHFYVQMGTKALAVSRLQGSAMRAASQCKRDLTA